jgi:DNA-binding transcriptional regulator YiaG
VTPPELIAGRTALRLSQVELARTLGVAANTVNRWEAGSRTIPPYLGLALDGIHHRHVCQT